MVQSLSKKVSSLVLCIYSLKNANIDRITVNMKCELRNLKLKCSLFFFFFFFVAKSGRKALKCGMRYAVCDMRYAVCGYRVKR